MTCLFCELDRARYDHLLRPTRATTMAAADAFERAFRFVQVLSLPDAALSAADQIACLGILDCRLHSEQEGVDDFIARLACIALQLQQTASPRRANG